MNIRRTPYAAFLALAVAACTSHKDDAPLEVRTAAAAAIDSTPAAVPTGAPPRRALSPLADTIASALVFAPRTQTWFVANARGKRMLVDIGRVDIEVRKDTLRLAAYREAVTALSRIRIGAHFRLRGPWGAEDGEVSGFDTWNGRIVATLKVSPRLDSLAKKVDPLPAAALLTDSVTVAAPDKCKRDTVPTVLAERAAFARDSLELELRQKAVPPYERLMASEKVQSSQAIGCFGIGRVISIVSLRAGSTEYVQERIVALDDTGAVTPLRTSDFRFKAHDAIYALDADADGVDDLAVRGLTEAAGATVILRLDPKQKRLDRLASGFAWESR